MLIPHLVGWRHIGLHERLHASFDLRQHPVEYAAQACDLASVRCVPAACVTAGVMIS